MNFKGMCRTCLRSGETLSSLFDEEIEPAKHTAADLLGMFTSVQVDKEDDFPHSICDICLKEIQQAYLFVLKCKKSEIILHQLREIRVNLKKLKEIPKQNDIVSEVAGELESILKEDFKFEDVMNLCDRNISDSESYANERIGSVEEENANAREKLRLRIVEEQCARDLQLAFKREREQSHHFMKDETNEKELERIVSNLQIVEEDCDPQITLKQEPDHNSPIIRNNAAQNKLELNQNSSKFEIFDECASEYEVMFKTEPDQNDFLKKDYENEEHLEFSVTDLPVTFKAEPELDIGIDYNDERLQCSDCLKQFQSLDMFRGHIVSDHLEENNCKLCNEEFECSQFEHSAKHLPISEPENPSGSSEESIMQTEKVHMKAIHKGESLDKSDFQCTICSKVFVHRYRLKDHIRTHTGEKPFDCKLCPEKFGNTTTLLYHKRTKHTDEFNSNDKPVSDFQCTVCNKVFGHKFLLRYHMRTHTGEKPFDCEFCPEKFRNCQTLLYHRRTKHTDELNSDDKPIPDLQCSVCYKVFGVGWRLRKHMLVHTGEKPFQCELCPAKFGQSNTLQYHRRTKHTDQLISNDKLVKDLQCSVCSKIFGHKYLLRDHMRVHTGEKPFQCNLCPEKFRMSQNLLFHRRTKHTDELISDDKPVPDFQCSVCYKVFGRKSLLKMHMPVHISEQMFQCQACPEKFRKSVELLRHRGSKHTDELISDVLDLQCNVCSKIFGMKHQLKNHMLVHTNEKPFDCELCPEKFGSRSAMLCHRRTKHTDAMTCDIPDFQCSVCSKIFGYKYRLKNHMRVHTGEKPFHCKLCPEKFGRNESLQSHERTKHTDEQINEAADFKCSVCYKVFGYNYQLRRHMHVHTGEKPFQCKLCPKKFARSHRLKTHMQTKHTDRVIEKPDYKCKVCSKVFVFKQSLSRHMRLHTRVIG